MKNVIITGPTGAIGVALVELLTQADIGVLAVCREGSARIRNLRENSRIRQDLLEVIEIDLSQLKQLPEQLKEYKINRNYDVFYHFAWANTFGADARNDVNAQLGNIQYTIDALEVAKELGCKRFIGSGSQAEYGRVEGKLSPETPANPENGYGIAKLAAGQLSRIRAQQLGIEHVWTRILSVYGPYDGANTMVMSLIRKLKTGERPALTPCQQRWDYMNSKDAARAFKLLGESGEDGQTYVLGSGNARPLKEYVETIRAAVNPTAEIGYGDVAYSDKQVMHLEADISKLQEDTGFEIEVEFSEGIRELL